SAVQRLAGDWIKLTVSLFKFIRAKDDDVDRVIKIRGQSKFGRHIDLATLIVHYYKQIHITIRSCRAVCARAEENDLLDRELRGDCIGKLLDLFVTHHALGV